MAGTVVIGWAGDVLSGGWWDSECVSGGTD